MRDMGPILADKAKLVGFAREVINAAFQGGSLDGIDIQEWGVKYGLLVEEEFDPEKHIDNYEGEFEEGDKIYLYTNILNLPQAIESTAIAQAEGQIITEDMVNGNDCKSGECS